MIVSYRVESATDELEAAMLHLRKTLRGVPVDMPGFRASYDKARKTAGELLVALTDSKSKVRAD